MLSGKQKRYLRALASKEKALFQIGKDGLTENIIDTVSKAIKVHELIKISVLKSCEEDTNEIAINLAASTSSEIVQIIGKNIVLYKQSREKKIELPK